MRTTLDIDDEVLRAAKELARRHSSTAGAVISELARRALLSSPDGATGVNETPAFYGFRPLAAGQRLVSTETVERVREEEVV